MLNSLPIIKYVGTSNRIWKHPLVENFIFKVTAHDVVFHLARPRLTFCEEFQDVYLLALSIVKEVVVDLGFGSVLTQIENFDVSFVERSNESNTEFNFGLSLFKIGNEGGHIFRNPDFLEDLFKLLATSFNIFNLTVEFEVIKVERYFLISIILSSVWKIKSENIFNMLLSRTDWLSTYFPSYTKLQLLFLPSPC